MSVVWQSAKYALIFYFSWLSFWRKNGSQFHLHFHLTFIILQLDFLQTLNESPKNSVTAGSMQFTSNNRVRLRGKMSYCRLYYHYIVVVVPKSCLSISCVLKQWKIRTGNYKMVCHIWNENILYIFIRHIM